MASDLFNGRLTIMHVINEPVDLRGFYVPHVSFENLEKEIEEGAQKMMSTFISRIVAMSFCEPRSW